LTDYCVSGISYKSYDYPEPWEANVLLTPRTNLATDSILAFNLSTPHRGSLDIFATSDVGHFAFRIATFADSSASSAADSYNETVYNMTYEVENDNDNTANISLTFSTESVCVPSNSYRVAFIGSAIPARSTGSVQADAVIKDVALTDTPCTAQSLPGE